MTSTLSVIVDQRCCDDTAMLCRRVRDIVLDTCLEVVHVAWWNAPPPSTGGNAGVDGGVDATSVRRIPNLRIGLQIIADNEVTRTIAPLTDIASLGAIRDLFGSGYQQQLRPTRSLAEWVAPLVTHAQVSSIANALQTAIQDAATLSSAAFAQTGEALHRQEAVHAMLNATHVVLVTTVFHTQTFSSRAATVLPPLVSFPHPVAVSVVHIDADVKSSSHLNVAPSVVLVRHPLGHREMLAAAVLPPLLRWAAPCLLPVDVPVALSVGQRVVGCRASCALVSTLPRWSMPDAMLRSSTVGHGWHLVDSAYNDARWEPQQSLKVERCVPRRDVDEAYLYGESWYITPALVDAESRGWWNALYEVATTSSSSGVVAEQPSTSTKVLLLSASNHFFAPQSSIGLQLHCFVGIFAPDGASMLLRALAPNECRRTMPPEPQLSMRASQFMVDELRSTLTPTHSVDGVSGDSHEHQGLGGTRSRNGRGGVTVAVGLLYQAEASAARHGHQRMLQVTSQHPHSNGLRASTRGGRGGSRGGGGGGALLHYTANAMNQHHPQVAHH